MTANSSIILMLCSLSRKTASMDCVPHSYLQVGEWQVGILKPQPFYILPKLNCVQLSAVL